MVLAACMTMPAEERGSAAMCGSAEAGQHGLLQVVDCRHQVALDCVLTGSRLQGPWAPRKIPNPDYFLDEAPLAAIGSVGGVAVEIWTMDEGYVFDNVLVANDPALATAKREQLWIPKKEAEARVCPVAEHALLALPVTSSLLCSLHQQRRRCRAAPSVISALEHCAQTQPAACTSPCSR